MLSIIILLYERFCIAVKTSVVTFQAVPSNIMTFCASAALSLPFCPFSEQEKPLGVEPVQELSVNDNGRGRSLSWNSRRYPSPKIFSLCFQFFGLNLPFLF